MEHINVDSSNIERIRQYLRFRALCSKLNLKDTIPTPAPYDLKRVIKLMEMAISFQDDFSWVDDHIKSRIERRFLEYGDKEYIILMPTCLRDYFEEVFNQHYNLMNSLCPFSNGDKLILFLRRINTMDEPFCSVTVENNQIEYVYGPHNLLPDIQVFEFLKKYSRTMGLTYDPVAIIDETFEMMDYTEGYSDWQLSSLKAYADMNRH